MVAIFGIFHEAKLSDVLRCKQTTVIKMRTMDSKNSSKCRTECVTEKTGTSYRSLRNAEFNL